MTIHSLEPAARKRAGLVSVDGRTYPLSSVRIEARAEGGIALSRLTQVFENPHDEALEVIYTLPLPADGAVLGYTIKIGEKVIRAEVEPREKAEAMYRDAVYAGHTAGLLEQDRADTFQQRLGNLPARTRAEVEIEVLQPLAFLAAVEGRDPAWEYRFPTVTGVRYQGAPGRVPDAERLDVDRVAEGGIPTRAEFSLAIADAPDRAATATSPSHAVDVAVGDSRVDVRFRRGERLDRDIAVRWAACTGDVGVRIVEGRGLQGDDGRYALVTVVPPAVPAISFHRDLTLLIDASGSMSGAPLECAKHVAGVLVDSLGRDDRFEVIAFAEHPRHLTGGLQAATESARLGALEALAALRAGGCTEMARAVDEALRPLRTDTQRQVVLLTDGYIGFEEEIVDRAATKLPPGCRLHAVGIGSAPNRTLIHGAARAGRGTGFIVNSEGEAVEAAARLLAATSQPVLTDLVVRGSALRALAPGRPADVFAGSPLVLTAELEAAGGTLEIEGRLAGSREAWRHRLEVPAAGAGGLASSPMPIGALHGREVIADLEQDLSITPRREEAFARIESRGMRHRIASIRTSLVAIADEPSVDARQPRRRTRLAVELPAGVSAEGVGLGIGPAMYIGMAEARAPWAEGVVPEASATGPAKGPSWFAAWRRTRSEEDPASAPPSRWDHPLELWPARIIERRKDLLVVEFEVPLDGFELPEGAVEVTSDDRTIGRAVADRGESSPRGPHRAGLVVRLALRLDGKMEWPADGELVLRWRHPGRGFTDRSVTVVLPVETEAHGAS